MHTSSFTHTNELYGSCQDMASMFVLLEYVHVPMFQSANFTASTSHSHTQCNTIDISSNRHVRALPLPPPIDSHRWSINQFINQSVVLIHCSLEKNDNSLKGEGTNWLRATINQLSLYLSPPFGQNHQPLPWESMPWFIINLEWCQWKEAGASYPFMPWELIDSPKDGGNSWLRWSKNFNHSGHWIHFWTSSFDEQRVGFRGDQGDGFEDIPLILDNLQQELMKGGKKDSSFSWWSRGLRADA